MPKCERNQIMKMTSGYGVQQERVHTTRNGFLFLSHHDLPLAKISKKFKLQASAWSFTGGLQVPGTSDSPYIHPPQILFDPMLNNAVCELSSKGVWTVISISTFLDLYITETCKEQSRMFSMELQLSIDVPPAGLWKYHQPGESKCRDVARHNFHSPLHL